MCRGWDDPRMPTLRGMRRRGYTPQAIRDFIDQRWHRQGRLRGRYRPAGSTACATTWAASAPRAMAVLNPLQGGTHQLCRRMAGYPDDGKPSRSSRNGRRVRCTIGRELCIEREDFMEEPPKKYLPPRAPGREVRLKGAYIIKLRATWCIPWTAASISIDMLGRSVLPSPAARAPTARSRAPSTGSTPRDCAPFEARLYDSC